MKKAENCIYVECQHCGHEVEINLEEYGLREEPSFDDFKEEIKAKNH